MRIDYARRRGLSPAPRWLELPWAVAALFFVIGVTHKRMVFARTAVYPGHADPAFFYNVAQNMHSGKGQTIDYVWQFLVPQKNLNHYAFDYWLPLPSWLMSLGLKFGHGLPGAIDVGIWMAVLLSVAVYALTRELTHSPWAPALAAVVVLIAPGTSRFAIQTESAIYLAAFALATIAAAVYARRLTWMWVPTGALAALAVMARSEGMLLSVALGLCVLVWSGNSTWSMRLRLLLAGYIPVIAYYLVQNVRHFGALLPPASSAFPFIVSYEELFAVHVPHTFRALIGGQGWKNFYVTRTTSFSGLLNALLNVLTPATTVLVLMLMGAFVFRRRTPEVGPAEVGPAEVGPAEVAAAESTGASVIDVSPDERAVAERPAGQRFGLVRQAWRNESVRRLRTSAWLLPALFVVGTIVLDCVFAPLVSAAGATIKVFVTIGPLLIVAAVAGLVRARLPIWLTAGIAAVLVLGTLPTIGAQDRSVVGYNNRVGYNQIRFLKQLQAEQSCLGQPLVMMTRQPWEFTQATGFPSVQLPSGDEADILAIARKYQVTDIYGASTRTVLTNSIQQATASSGPFRESPELPHPQFLRVQDTTAGAHC